MIQDHYQVLNVAAEASSEEIQRAYRALALLHHPDRNRAPEAASMMSAINLAYEVLGDPERRRQYDAQRAQPGNIELGGWVLAAARDVLLRSGWTLQQDLGRILLLEKEKMRVRAVLLDRVNKDMILRLSYKYAEFLVVLAISIDSPLLAAPRTIVINLMTSERFGPASPDEPPALKSLLSGFL